MGISTGTLALGPLVTVSGMLSSPASVNENHTILQDSGQMPLPFVNSSLFTLLKIISPFSESQ
jgi:hypothetical protein